MNQNTKLFILLIGIFCISCHSIVQTQFDDFEAVPVVNSILRSGDTIKVHVSLSKKVGGVDFTMVDNAEVRLYEHGVFKETLTHADSGYYASSTIAQAETNYRFEIDIPERDLINVSDSLPAFPEIIEVNHISKAGRDEEGTVFPAVEITFSNNTERNQWFEIIIQKVDKKLICKYDSVLKREVRVGSEVFLNDNYWMPDIVDPVLFNEGIDYPVFSDELISDSLYKLQINYTFGMSQGYNGIYYESLRPLVIELRAVSEAYYNYTKQHILYEAGAFADGIGQSVTAIPLYSNVENGYGIVAGYSHCSTDTIIPEPYEF